MGSGRAARGHRGAPRQHRDAPQPGLPPQSPRPEPGEALAQVEAAERRGLRHPTLLTWKAELLAGLGRVLEAETAAREALRLNPAVRLVLADLRARAGDRDGAVRQLRDLLELPDLSPDQRRQAEERLRALPRSP